MGVMLRVAPDEVSLTPVAALAHKTGNGLNTYYSEQGLRQIYSKEGLNGLHVAVEHRKKAGYGYPYLDREGNLSYKQEARIIEPDLRPAYTLTLVGNNIDGAVLDLTLTGRFVLEDLRDNYFITPKNTSWGYFIAPKDLIQQANDLRGSRIVRMDENGFERERVYLTGDLNTSRIEVVRGKVIETAPEALRPYVGDSYSEIYAIDPQSGRAGVLSGWAVDIGEKKLVIDTTIINFHYIKQIDLNGDIKRRFGVITGDQREIRIKFDEELFEVPASFGADTYIVKEENGIYYADYRISNSQVINYNVDNLEPIFESIRSQIEGVKLPNPALLNWTKITMLAPNGKEINHSYQAFVDSADPVIKITDNGILDVVFMIKDKKYSLRYDLNQGTNNLLPIAISRHLSENSTIVVDFDREPVCFIVLRDELNGLVGKLHININDEEKTKALFNSASLSTVMDLLEQLSEDTKISLNLKSLEFTLPQGLTIDRKEFFTYNSGYLLLMVGQPMFPQLY